MSFLRSLPALPFLASVLAGVGCQGTVSAPDSASPARPQPERLRADVAWLAADAREGRRAGTPGEAISARWLAQRLEALGVEPLGSDGFLQPFTVPLPARDGGGSFVEAGAADGRVRGATGTSVVPLFCSGAGEAQGPLVFAGYGIALPEKGWDDYAVELPEGAVVLVVRGTPPEERARGEAPAAVPNPHGGGPSSGSVWEGSGALLQKVVEAKRRGARAVLVAQHPDRDEPLPVFDTTRGTHTSLPALHVSAALAEGLIPGYADLVRRLDRGEPVERPLVAGVEARVKADVVRESGTARNVLGRIRGTGAAPTVLVGAHFDHLGRGGPGSLAPEARGEVHNGADDNASGTAVVLELARLFRARPPEGDVVVAFWSGEELGLLGSEHWAKNPTLPLEEVACVVNLDMVGRAESGRLAVLGAGSAKPFVDWASELAERSGLDVEVSPSGQGVGGSDHQTFLERKIPAIHLFTGLHADYHRPSDDAERFEAEGAARVAAFAEAFVRRVQASGRPVWIDPPAPAETAQRGGFRTRFGSIPDYAFGGPGLRLDGTSPGGPAERAGLLRGDVIVRIDDVEIEGMPEFMYVLNAHKPGDVVRVHFLRDGHPEEVLLTLEGTQAE